MATPTLASTSRRRTITARIAALLVGFVIVAVLLVAAWAYHRVRACLPQVDGRLQVRGLAAPVSVIRDAQGVPHIRASSIEDLLFAQAYVTGYCIGCPESAETVMTDMREIGPTYYFAPPRVLENLLTQVSIRMEDASRVKRWRWAIRP